MKLIYLLLPLLLIGSASALLDPDTGINWSKTINQDATFDGNITATGTVSAGTTISNGKIDDGLWVDDSLYVSNTSALNATTVTTLAASGKANIGGAVTTTSTAKVGGALTGQSITSNSTVTVTSADGLTVGDKIISQTYTTTLNILSAPVDTPFWVAPFACKVLSINEEHTTAQNTAFPNTGSVLIYKASDGAASAVALHNATMYLNGTARTKQAPTLNASTGATSLAANQHLYADFNGTQTTLAGLSITVQYQRV